MLEENRTHELQTQSGIHQVLVSTAPAHTSIPDHRDA